MRKPIILLTLFLFVSFVSSQPVEEPKKGDTLFTLIESLEETTEATRKNSDLIRDLRKQMKAEFNFWISIHLVGNALMMWAIYLFMLFLEKRRIGRNKKTYQELIKELEDKVKATEQGLIETLSHTNQLATDSNGRLRQFISDMDRFIKAVNYEPKDNKILYMKLIGVGVILGYGVNYLVGVF